MMTKEQEEVVRELEKGCLSNMDEYGQFSASNGINMTLMKNNFNASDENIVAKVTAITGLNKIGMPDLSTTFYIIEPSGKYYDIFQQYPSDKAVLYLKKLQPFIEQ